MRIWNFFWNEFNNYKIIFKNYKALWLSFLLFFQILNHLKWIKGPRKYCKFLFLFLSFQEVCKFLHLQALHQKPSVLLEANTMLVWRLKDLDHVGANFLLSPIVLCVGGESRGLPISNNRGKIRRTISNNQGWNWTLQSLFHQRKILLKTRRRSQRRHGA
jgi:hypothetical protein